MPNFNALALEPLGLVVALVLSLNRGRCLGLRGGVWRGQITRARAPGRILLVHMGEVLAETGRLPDADLVFFFDRAELHRVVGAGDRASSSELIAGSDAGSPTSR